jgi:23S rRNA-/tRNA-specific pseudouridylate synthase
MPLIGDRTYHPAYLAPDPAHPPIDFPRQALHAQILRLEHPEQPGTRMSWTAELPKDLQQLEAALRAGRV